MKTPRWIRRLVYEFTGWSHHPFIGWYRIDRLASHTTPFCEGCGERNLVEIDGQTYWAPDYLHGKNWAESPCSYPRQRRRRERYIRRFGARAARRHGGVWV